MYRKDLELNLANANLSNYFLLFGADEFQIELFGKEILSFYSSEDANLLSLYFDEYNYAQASSHLSEQSLFGGKNILYVKSDKKIPAKELKELISLCSKSQDNYFLFELYESDMKLVFDTQKAFGTNFARFFKPSTPDEAINLLAKNSAKIGLNITKNALYELYFTHNENLYLAASELTKLKSLNTHIEQDDVKRLVFGLGGINFDDFFNKFMALKDIKNDFFTYLEDPNFNEILLLNSLYKAFFRLFKIYSYIKINGRLNLDEAIGYQPPVNVANLLKANSLKLSLNAYLEIFKTLNLAELELKTNTKMDKEIFVLSTILNLQHLISTANIK